MARHLQGAVKLGCKILKLHGHHQKQMWFGPFCLPRSHFKLY